MSGKWIWMRNLIVSDQSRYLCSIKNRGNRKKAIQERRAKMRKVKALICSRITRMDNSRYGICVIGHRRRLAGANTSMLALAGLTRACRLPSSRRGLPASLPIRAGVTNNIGCTGDSNLCFTCTPYVVLAFWTFGWELHLINNDGKRLMAIVESQITTKTRAEIECENQMYWW